MLVITGGTRQVTSAFVIICTDDRSAVAKEKNYKLSLGLLLQNLKQLKKKKALLKSKGNMLDLCGSGFT